MRLVQAALVFSAASVVHAFSNTSPFVLVSNTQGLRVSESLESGVLDPMNPELAKLVGESVSECGYDAYVFVEYPNAAAGAFNRENMPFLSMAVDKATDALLRPDLKHVDLAAEERAIADVKTYLRDTCNVAEVEVNVDSKEVFTPYSDTHPRGIYLDFDVSHSAKDIDNTLKRVIGRLPSPNFLLFVRTTPAVEEAPSQDGDEIDEAYESLFKNYQFFSPALLMSLLVSGLLLAVFVIALRSVGSLQISAAAFEPKQQQAGTKQ